MCIPLDHDLPPAPDAMDAIRERRNKVFGFEHKHFPDASFQQEGLAELGPDGKWLTWDMRIPLSFEACDFIANAPRDIDTILTALATATARAERAEAETTRYHAAYKEQRRMFAEWLDDQGYEKPDGWIAAARGYVPSGWDDPALDVYDAEDG